MIQCPQAPATATFLTRDLTIPRQALDPAFVTRMEATLCPGLFEFADPETSRHIIGNCIAHCSDSRDVVTKVLQLKFIGGHSPSYWVLAGSDGATRLHTVPPLLVMFLEMCTSLSAEIQEEIADALLKINKDTLLQQLSSSLPHICGPGMMDPDFDQAAVVAGYTESSSAQISFRIPQFFDRILISHEIVLPACLANEILWVVRAKVNTGTWTSNLRWILQVAETKTRKKHNFPTGDTQLNHRRITVNIPEIDTTRQTQPYLHWIETLTWTHSTRATNPEKTFRSQVGSINIAIPDQDLASFHATLVQGGLCPEPWSSKTTHVTSEGADCGTATESSVHYTATSCRLG